MSENIQFLRSIALNMNLSAWQDFVHFRVRNGFQKSLVD